MVVLRVPQVPPWVASTLEAQVKRIPVPNAGRAAPTAATTKKNDRYSAIAFTNPLRKLALVLFLHPAMDGGCRRRASRRTPRGPETAGYDYTIFLMKTLLAPHHRFSDLRFWRSPPRTHVPDPACSTGKPPISCRAD